MTSFIVYIIVILLTYLYSEFFLKFKYTTKKAKDNIYVFESLKKLAFTTGVFFQRIYLSDVISKSFTQKFFIEHEKAHQKLLHLEMIFMYKCILVSAIYWSLINFGYWNFLIIPIIVINLGFLYQKIELWFEYEADEQASENTGLTEYIYFLESYSYGTNSIKLQKRIENLRKLLKS